jgi:alpha-tubulin suppressor-like RCC1 family protein
VTVAGLGDAVHIGAGSLHVCARRISGAVMCWGSNSVGQLGVSSVPSSSTPVAVPGLDDALIVEGGAQHTCATRVDGTLWCWGNNGYGQLGDGTTTSHTDPEILPTLPSSIFFDAGTRFTCAINPTGLGLCWGENSSGQLGIGTAFGNPSSPAPVRGPTDWVEIRGGFDFACGRRVTGQVYCWGSNAYGQLGNGTMTNSTLPAPVLGP